MTNLPHKNEQGVVTFLTACIMLLLIGFIVVFSASYTNYQQKITANLNRNTEALLAAEAGVDYGINYLNVNRSTILANPVGGYIVNYTSANTTNVALATGATFSITYTNPVASNYNLILIQSTGTSGDGTATKTIRTLVQYGSLLYKVPEAPLVSTGEVTLSGSASVINTTGTTTVQSGSTVNIGGSASTTNSLGVNSTPSGLSSDVQTNVSSLNNASIDTLLGSYFGMTSSQLKAHANATYSNLGNYNSVLNGVTGQFIWIDQTSDSAVINGSTTIGSAANPVIVVINGNAKLSGSVNIYGLLIILGGGEADFLGGFTIHGALISASELTLKGSTLLNYGSSTLANIQNSINTYYAKVPGSWRDF